MQDFFLPPPPCYFVQVAPEILDDEEVNPDEAEEAQSYDAVSASLEDTGEINLDDVEKVTLDLLVTKFIQGESIRCGFPATSYCFTLSPRR